MKKLLLLLTLVMTTLVGHAGGYTISFQKGTNDGNSTSSTASNFVTNCVNSGSEYIGSVTTCEAVYAINSAIKMAKSKGPGTLDIALSAAGKINAKTVVINAKGTKDLCTLEFNGKSINLTQEYADYTITLDGSALTNIKLVAAKGKQINVKTLTVSDGEGGGTVEPAPETAPTEITFAPLTGSVIDTNTSISLSTDVEGCEIRYAIDGTATKESTLYEAPFTLGAGQHTVDVIAWNSANEDKPISASATYTVNQYVAPATIDATITFTNHSWGYTATTKNLDWTSDDNKFKFPTTAGINDTSGGSGSTYPTTVSAGFRVYYSSRSFVNVTAPDGYYFESLSYTLADTKEINIDGKTTTNNSYTFTGKPTTFKITARSANATLKTMTIKLAKIETGPVAPEAPVFSIADGSTVEVGSKVTVSCATEGALFNGFVNESEPLEDKAMPFDYTFTTTGTCKIEGWTTLGELSSDPVSVTYTVVNPKVATPTFSIADGSTVEVGEKLTISSTTEGATATIEINDDILEEALPFTYTFATPGSYTVNVVASKEGLDDSEQATATYTVTAFAAPSAPVFSKADGSAVAKDSKVTITAEGATAIEVLTYGIDGYPTSEKVEGATAEITVNKMQRRFAAIAHREANGQASASEQVEVFYTIGNRGEIIDGYTLVTDASELYDGMEFVMVASTSTTDYVLSSRANGYDRIWYGDTGATINDNTIDVTNIATAMPLVLEQAPNGDWYIKTRDKVAFYDNGDPNETKDNRKTPRVGYFYDYSNPSNTSQNFLQMSEKPKASTKVIIGENGATTISFSQIHASGESDYIIRYNTQTGGGFSMYADTQTETVYPLPRLYAKKADLIEGDENAYTMSFHHTPVKLKDESSAVRYAATRVDQPVPLTASEPAEDGTITYKNKVENLLGEFALDINGHMLTGHIDDNKCDNGCEHPYVYFSNKATKRLALAIDGDETRIPLTTNNADHQIYSHHANPTITVNVKPFYNMTMTLESNEGSVTTGVENVAVDDNDHEVEYFNIQGMKVDGQAPGLYIRRQGSKVEKVFVN